MPGGQFHSPIWTPYAIYVEVDHVYGWKAFNNGDGFPAAQSTMNLVEVALYFVYLWIVLKHGGNSAADGRGAPGKAAVGRLGESKVVRGRMAGLAALAGYTGAALTVGKTLLYGIFYFYRFKSFPPISLKGVLQMPIPFRIKSAAPANMLSSHFQAFVNSTVALRTQNITLGAG
jgi:hypothetical protein